MLEATTEKGAVKFPQNPREAFNSEKSKHNKEQQ